VEHQIRRIDRSQITAVDEVPDQSDTLNEAIGQIDAEEAVGRSGSSNHAGGFGFCPSERLLAEHRDATLQGCNGLVGMKRAGCGDHQPVQASVEQMIQRLAGPTAADFRCGGSVLCSRIADADDLDKAALGQCLQAVSADPAHAQKTHPRLGHVRTRAFRKPSGR
jgi:hypothetical protein